MYVQFTERISGPGRATCQVRVCVWVIYMTFDLDIWRAGLS